MKGIIALAALLLVNVAFACPDFSGHFAGPRGDENLDITVVQKDCMNLQASITNNSGTRTENLILDGQYRMTQEEGTKQVFSAATWQGESLLNVTVVRDGEENVFSSISQYTLVGGNLVEVSIETSPTEGTQTNTFTYTRK